MQHICNINITIINLKDHVENTDWRGYCLGSITFHAVLCCQLSGVLSPGPPGIQAIHVFCRYSASPDQQRRNGEKERGTIFHCLSRVLCGAGGHS